MKWKSHVPYHSKLIGENLKISSYQTTYIAFKTHFKKYFQIQRRRKMFCIRGAEIGKSRLLTWKLLDFGPSIKNRVWCDFGISWTSVHFMILSASGLSDHMTWKGVPPYASHNVWVRIVLTFGQFSGGLSPQVSIFRGAPAPPGSYAGVHEDCLVVRLQLR